MTKYIVKETTEKQTSTGKPMYPSTLVDEAGVLEKVNLWDKVAVDQEIDGEIYTNDKGYRNFKSSAVKPSGKPNMERVMEKKAGMIAESQEKKAENIKQAQDRTAWIHAKNGAVELYMHLYPSATNMDEPDEALSKINDIANKIYHMETIPFN